MPYEIEQLLPCFEIPENGFKVFGRSEDDLVFWTENAGVDGVIMALERHTLLAICHAPHNDRIVTGGSEDLLRIVAQ